MCVIWLVVNDSDYCKLGFCKASKDFFISFDVALVLLAV